jgi:hypothetical protein
MDYLDSRMLRDKTPLALSMIVMKNVRPPSELETSSERLLEAALICVYQRLMKESLMWAQCFSSAAPKNVPAVCRDKNNSGAPRFRWRTDCRVTIS